jgi:phosphate transport system substrate-binding protein
MTTTPKKNPVASALHYFSWLMAITFILVGLWVVVYGRDQMKVSAFASVCWGITLLLYGFFRCYRLYQKKGVKLHEDASLLLVACLLMSCSQGKPSQATDTATTGSIRIAVDESLKPLGSTEVEVFESIYQQANISAVYTSEKEAIEQLLHDSVRCIMITRELQQAESEALLSQKLVPHSVKVAYDGIAIILHPQRADTLLTVAQLKSMMTGKRQPDTSKQERFVMDHPQSGMMRYLKDSILQGEECASCFAVNSNPAVIEYVATHPEAIGLVGVEWIKNPDDSIANRFIKQVKVAYLKKSGEEEFVQPYQAYIATGKYPLRRKVYIISREARTGLGSGFLSFVASDRGQRIVLKAGLVPATMPVRLVEVKQEYYDD